MERKAQQERIYRGMNKPLLASLMFLLLYIDAQAQYTHNSKIYDNVDKRHSLIFVGNSDTTYFTLDFGDTLKLVTHMPVDSCAKLFVDAVNKYYNSYVDSLKRYINQLKRQKCCTY